MESTVKHVLLVEDNPAHARLIRTHLEDFIGLSIDWVQRGEDALEYLRSRTGQAGGRLPDLILLDLKLPGMHGPEVLQQIRSESRTCQIPVVVLTTSQNDRDVGEAYAQGVNSYLVKSADSANMQAMLHDAVAFWCEWNQVPRDQDGVATA